MHRFSRYTIIKAFDLLFSRIRTHAELDRFMLLFGLEDRFYSKPYLNAKIVGLMTYCIQNPLEIGPKGGNLIFELIEYIIIEAVNRYQYETDDFVELENSLKRDGYTIQDKKLRSALPESVQLPEKENELFSLLDKFNFTTEKGHLEQAISAHARGDWASANAQLRSFMEGLFDSIAEKLAPNQGALPQTGHPRRNWLSNNPTPPFFQADLNEWQGDGKGFVQGLFRRLHPQGSHPGLSDEDDSTFRLHLMLLTALHYLRRLSGRL